MKIIQITDPHLVAPGQQLWGGDPAERLARCLEDVNRYPTMAPFGIRITD